MKKLAIFVSGSGTNMENIIKKIKRGKKSHAEVTLVVSDKQNAPALRKARKHEVSTLFINPKSFKTKKAYEREIIKQLKRAKIDYIVLAGFMRILTPHIIKAYKNKMINIHPSLLPAFKGAHGIKDAYHYGVKVTGVTVHFVTDDLDAGPIILQKAIPIKEGETCDALEARIHKVEYQLYPQAIDLLVANKLTIRGNKVRIK